MASRKLEKHCTYIKKDIELANPYQGIYVCAESVANEKSWEEFFPQQDFCAGREFCLQEDCVYNFVNYVTVVSGVKLGILPPISSFEEYVKILKKHFPEKEDFCVDKKRFKFW